MSTKKKEAAIAVIAEHLPSPTELFAPARKFHEAAKLHSALGCAAMVMAGAEIIRLKKELGVVNGGDRRPEFQAETLLPEGMTWERAVEQYAGISKSTAWRYSEMAVACAKKVKGLATLIDAAPGDITEDQRDQIAKAVHKVTDGHTATELFREWGLAKLDPSAEALKAKTKAIADSLPADPVEAEQHVMELTKQEKAEADCVEWLKNTEIYFLKHNAWKRLPDDLLNHCRTMAVSILERIGKPRT